MDISKNYNMKLSRRKAIALLGLSTVAVQFPIACVNEQSNEGSTVKEPIHYMT
jgi:hypothetical protein